MRITIDLDQETKAALMTVAQQDDMSVADGGEAAAALAEGIGGGLRDAAYDADMGPPPNWLIAAVEAAILSEPVAGDASAASTGEILEGGKAPD